jgi:hypothetical protein
MSERTKIPPRFFAVSDQLQKYGTPKRLIRR